MRIDIFSLFAIVFCIMCYQKFYVNASKLMPTKDDQVVVSKDNPSQERTYELSKYLDGNFDGKITLGEQKRAYKFTHNPDYMVMYNFAANLSRTDRSLVDGLTYQVAQKAVTGLSQKQKVDLLDSSKFNKIERINKINKIFS